MVMLEVILVRDLTPKARSVGFEELAKAAHEARQLVNVAVLLKEKEKFTLSHVPRVLPNSVSKLTSKRIALVKREQSLNRCMDLLSRGVAQLQTNRVQQSHYLANVCRLQKLGWRIFATAHSNKQTLPLRTEEPLSVDCSFRSAAKGYEGKLSMARVSTKMEEAIIVDETPPIFYLTLTMESMLEERPGIIGMASLSPKDFAKAGEDFEAPLTLMLNNEFLHRLFQQILHEGFMVGKFSSGTPSAASKVAILASHRDSLTIGLNAELKATFALVPGEGGECANEAGSDKAMTEAAKTGLLLIAARFRKCGSVHEKSQILQPFLNRMQHWVTCGWVRYGNVLCCQDEHGVCVVFGILCLSYGLSVMARLFMCVRYISSFAMVCSRGFY